MESITFTLKHGLSLDGAVHKEVEMRPLLTGDIKVLARDKRIQELAKNNHEIEIGALALSGRIGVADIAAALMSGGMKVDPVRMQYIQSAVAEVHSILFSRTVIRIGELRSINPATFDNMRHPDFLLLIQKHNELNAVEGDAVTASKSEAPRGPLA